MAECTVDGNICNKSELNYPESAISRCANFTETEKGLLIDLVDRYKKIWKRKCNDLKVAKANWEQLSRDFNCQSSEGMERTSKQLRRCYENINVRKNWPLKMAGLKRKRAITSPMDSSDTADANDLIKLDVDEDLMSSDVLMPDNDTSVQSVQEEEGTKVRPMESLNAVTIDIDLDGIRDEINLLRLRIQALGVHKNLLLRQLNETLEFEQLLNKNLDEQLERELCLISEKNVFHQLFEEASVEAETKQQISLLLNDETLSKGSSNGNVIPNVKTRKQMSHSAVGGSRQVNWNICKSSKRADVTKNVRTNENDQQSVCSICKKKFFKRHSLQIHMRLEHNSNLSKSDGCVICSNSIDPDADDQGGSDSYRKLICSPCLKAFPDLSRIENNVKETRWRQFSCAKCTYRFNDRERLLKHARCHFVKLSHVCHLCAKSYSTKQSLEYHMNAHVAGTEVQCTVCSKKLASNYSLKNHMLMHNGVLNYTCAECGKSYAYAASLKQHMRTHSGERPYCCILCPKTFTMAGHLKTHVTSHTGEKRLKCKVCPARFRLHSVLKKHMWRHMRNGDIV